MDIRVKIDSMKAAERLSQVCKGFPYELNLRAGVASADPKSTLGVLAMMYADRRNLRLDTGDMPDEVMSEFTSNLTPFLMREAM